MYKAKLVRYLAIVFMLVMMVSIISGCTPQADTKEDPLANFGVDASLPFETLSPDAAATPALPLSSQTPAPDGNTPDWWADGDPGDTQTDDTDVTDDTDDTDYSDDYVDYEDDTPTKKPSGATPKPEFKKLSFGDSGEYVVKLQNRLIKLGYLTTTATGNYIGMTEDAVKLFQKAVGAQQTGVATVSLQETLFSPDAPKYKKSSEPTKAPAKYSELMRGDTGDAVKRLQQRLKDLGYFTANVGGNFLDETEKAVERFQKQIGAEQTGVASVKLQEKLFAKDAPKYVKSTPKPTAKPTKAPAKYTELEHGSTGDAVKRLQQRLKDLGYFTANVGGNFLDETEKAVKRFQKEIDVEQTGVASVKLQEKLFAKDAPKYVKTTPKPTAKPTKKPDDGGLKKLKHGDTGDAVKRLQQRLKTLGYFTANVGGNFLDETEKAVKRFQKQIGDEQTGVASVALLEMIFADDAPEYVPPKATPKATPKPKTKPASEPSDEDGFKKLSPGAKGDAVKRLQQRLKDLGYFTGDIGGNYLDLTTDAVKKFQKAIGAKQSGTASSGLQERLFSSSAPPAKLSELTEGDSNAYVKMLKARLSALGYYNGKINSTYDADTSSAVMTFQADAGLDQTGVADKETQKKLYSEDAPGFSEGVG